MEENKIMLDDNLLELIEKVNPGYCNYVKITIGRNGYFSIALKGKKTVKIYEIKLAVFLSISDIPEYDINTIPFLETYCKAYNKGLKDFKNKYLNDENLLFGEYKEAFKNRLKNDYFLNGWKNVNGWNKVKSENIFMRVSHDLVSEYGYYSGLVSEADKIIDKYFDSKETKKETIFQFENNFDKVDPNKIYNYFKNNLVETGYLSLDDLEKYILLAFQGNLKQPIEKFSFKNLHIEKVRTIFYKYFVEIANKPHGKKRNYAQLLGDYFKGFTTEKVENNFASGYIIVRK